MLNLLFDIYHWLISLLPNIGIRPFNATIFWSFFGGFGTIVAISIAYLHYNKTKKENEAAQLNAIVDEIYHNLNLSYTFSGKTTEGEVKFICSKLNNLSETERYPIPNDDPKSL